MYFIKPEKLIFENERDVIDYVAKGLPPKKENFNNVMKALHEKPIEIISNDEVDFDELEAELDSYDDDKVEISPRVLNNIDPDTMEMVLRRVYDDNVRTRNTIIAIAGLTGVVIIGGMLFGGKKDKDK